MKNVKNMMAAILMIFTIAINAQPIAGTLYNSSASYNGMPVFISGKFYSSCTTTSTLAVSGYSFGIYASSTATNGTVDVGNNYGFSNVWIPGSLLGWYPTSINNPPVWSTLPNNSVSNSGVLNLNNIDTGKVVLATNVTQSKYQVLYFAVCSANIPTTTASFSANQLTVCAGGSLSFTNSSTSGLSQPSATNIASTTWPSKYTWIVNGSTVTTNSPGTSTTVPGTTGAPLSYTFSTPGTYTVSLVASNHSGPYSQQSTISKTITVISPTVTVSNATVCPGSSVVLTASGAVNYTWSTNSTATSITVSPTTQTTYTVIGNDGICTGAPSTVTVSIGVNPILNVSQPPFPICSGNSITLNASSSNGTITWPSGNQIVYPTSNTVYTIIATLNNCTASKTISVDVNPLPTIVVSPSVVCMNTNTVINASGASTYTWNGNFNGNSLSLNISTGTVLVVSGTDGNNCTSTTTVNINVVDCTVGIHENYMRPSFNVYPNPSAGVFNIDYKGNVEIFDASGNLVMSREVDGIVEVDLSPGLYIVRFDGKYNHKIIKQH